MQQLLVRVENRVGNLGRRLLAHSWTPAPQDVAAPAPSSTALTLVGAPDAVSAAGDASFRLGGWSAGSFLWRLDGGRWQESSGPNDVTMPVPGEGKHFWEAQLLSSFALSTSLLHSWSVGGAVTADSLALTRLLDGHHSLRVQAVDGAGNESGASEEVSVQVR